MTTETRKRIRAYKKALPELRERVIAVALLLAMSASMMGTASFAWLTISRNPEVTGVSTTIAANGNLEIALATSEDAPDESKVGDSSATEGQSVTAANITWGNLVNLSDPSYGLAQMVLRPARLNEEDLLNSPLYGAVFTVDGRVEKLTSNFRYTSWVQPEQGSGYFGVATHPGVKAVSSTKMDVTDSSFLRYLELQDNASSANSSASGAFDAIIANQAWMELLAKLMGFHMSATLESTNADYYDKAVTPKELSELQLMYGEFIEAFKLEASAMAALMNWQLYILYGGDEGKYTPYTANRILTSMGDYHGKGNEYSTKLVKNGKKDLSVDAGSGKAVISDIETFLYDYYMLCNDYEELGEILEKQKEAYQWTTDGLKTIINRLVTINDCLLAKKGESAKKVSTLLNEFTSGYEGYMSAMGYMNAECTATITNGVLFNFCQRTGAKMEVTKKTNGKNGYLVEASMHVNTMNIGNVTASVYVTIVTNASSPSVFKQDLDTAENLEFKIDSSQMTVMAQDTYALAVDLWVRTNAENSYLMLEGNILTQDHEEPVMGKNAASEDVPLYIVSRSEKKTGTDENGKPTETTITMNYDLYPNKYVKDETTGYYKAADDNDKWYRQDTFEEFELNDGETPTQQWKTVTEVIGYEGENRIWDREDNNNLTVDSTSQGSGSCYVYYADTPEDMARSLKLLKAMHVAFIDSEGNLLASADMDTDSHYEESGRVIVPLVLNVGSTDIGTEENPKRVITLLQKNVPTRITALVYLDGTMLSNENVLSASEIQGQLNIQFGSSGDISAIENEVLKVAERSVSATVTKARFNWDTDTDLTTTVKFLVAGEQPSTVTAFFVRKINESQGSREPVMTQFVFNEATGTWDCDYAFTAPGTYIMRTVELDGQEYVLKNTPEVVVEGFTIRSLDFSGQGLNISGRKFTVMTASNSASVDLTLRFASDDVSKMPSSVQGRFLRSDGTAVNVNFKYDANASAWLGTATFLAAGDYDLNYLVLDGEYTQLPDGMPITATISLGMKVGVYNNLDSKLIKFDPDNMTEDQKLLKMFVRILDESGNELPGLTDAKLIYRHSTDTYKTMDTDLTWNPTEKMYTGELKLYEAADPEKNIEEFLAGLGTWVFSSVNVGSNAITNDISSPDFSLLSPEPPSFDSVVGNGETQYAPNGTEAKMQVKMKNFKGITTMALVKNEYTKTSYYIIGQENSEGFTFNLPMENGKVDGHWVMEDLYAWKYFNEEGKEVQTTLMKGDQEWTYQSGSYIKADQLTIEEHEETPIARFTTDIQKANFRIKVVQTPTVTFLTAEADRDVTFNGTFLQTHTIGGDNPIKVKITDFEGKKLPNVSGVSLKYYYDGKSQDHGGYTSTSVTAKDDALVFDFAADNAGTTFTQSEDETVQHAGVYTPTFFSFTTDNGGVKTTYIYPSGNDRPLPSGIPKFTVKSTTPTVTISAITPSTKTDVDASNDKVNDEVKREGFAKYYGYKHSAHIRVASNTAYIPVKTDRSATVFFKCNYAATEDKYRCLGALGAALPEFHNYSNPTVTIKLANTGKLFEADDGKATLTFTDAGGNLARIYKTISNSETIDQMGYVWDGSKDTCTMYIGYYKGESAASDTKNPAGVISATKLVVVHGGYEYTFALGEAEKITITNNF